MNNITVGQIAGAMGTLTVIAGFFVAIFKWYKSNFMNNDGGLGNIYYDKNALNKNKLVVIPRMVGNVDKWRYFIMFNITNQTVHLRAKVDSDVTVNKIKF